MSHPYRLASVLFFLLVNISMTSNSWAQNTRDNPLLYEVLDRLQQLERELRQLRGDLEFIQHSQGRQTTTAATGTTNDSYMNQRLSDIEQRLIRLEGVLNGSSSARITKQNKEPTAQQSQQPPAATTPLARVASQTTPTPPNPQPTPDTKLASSAEQDAYNLALSRLRAGRYQQSANDFQTFINAYPASPLTSDAYYWLGESHYAKRDFKQAKQMFLLLGSRYPESDKLPDALLKLGYTYSELGDNDKARQVLQRLRSAFPGVPAANLAEKQLRRLP